MNQPVKETNGPTLKSEKNEGTVSPLAERRPAQDFFDFTRDELAEFLKTKLGMPAFRAGQLFQWVYQKKIMDFDQMTNIAREFRPLLAQAFRFPDLKIAKRQTSTDGTRKYVLELDDGTSIETVYIKQARRDTVCVSSQVGCGMGCRFCRTATMGFKRHLTASEIVRQLTTVIADAREFGDELDNIVFMGMGEPLHNVKNVCRAIQILKDDLGLNIGARKITVSTSGVVPGIKKFAEADLRVNLAVSLNATTDEVRERVMPVNKPFPISVLLDELRKFPQKPRKLITYEYVMLAGINDTQEDLNRLPKLLQDARAKVNLIPYNMNADLGFKSPTKEWVMHWQKTLLARGLMTTIRWSKGPDIDAACGQLAVFKKVEMPKSLPVIEGFGAAAS